MKLASCLCSFLLWINFQYAQNGIQTSINSLVKQPAFKHAGISICVLNESGDIIAAHNPDLSLIPASALKVLTTASALAILGPDFQFKTEIQHDGYIDKDGVLQGHLYIKGYGDPTLGSDQMPGVSGLEETIENFRLALQRKGIRQVNGYIVGDATHFETAANAPTWPWNDLGNYYASGVFGLNIHENQYYLRFKQVNDIGETPEVVEIEPAIPGMAINNEVKSAGKNTGDHAYIFGAPYNLYRFVRGTIPVGSNLFTIKGSIPDPPLLTAQVFLEKMDEIGIEGVYGATTMQFIDESTDQNRTTLSVHRSPSLHKIVERANQKSVNLYCEAMLKSIGYKIEEKGTTNAGIKAIQAYWSAKGMDFAGNFIEDGSGLSPRNSVTSYFLASLLLKTKEDATTWKAFEASLPIAGVSGTMKNFLKGTAAQGKIKAKSGSFDRVRAYTGYGETRNGQTLSFAILINNYTGSSGTIRREMGKIMEAICK